MLPTGISQRPITLRIPIGKTRCATIISAYAPTLTNSDQSVEEFYEVLGQTLQKITPTDNVIILWDFNARVEDDVNILAKSPTVAMDIFIMLIQAVRLILGAVLK